MKDYNTLLLRSEVAEEPSVAVKSTSTALISTSSGDRINSVFLIGLGLVLFLSMGVVGSKIFWANFKAMPNSPSVEAPWKIPLNFEPSLTVASTIVP